MLIKVAALAEYHLGVRVEDPKNLVSIDPATADDVEAQFLKSPRPIANWAGAARGALQATSRPAPELVHQPRVLLSVRVEAEDC